MHPAQRAIMLMRAGFFPHVAPQQYMAIDILRPARSIKIRAHEPEAVTTRSPNEIDPRDVGLDPEDVRAIWRSVEGFYRMRLNPSIALCIRHRGQVILDRAIGHFSGNEPGDPEDAEAVLATPDTLYNLFSGSKAITAMLVHRLHEEGKIHIDEPVATFIPEFAKHRKHRITIKDLLSHRAGIPAAPIQAVRVEYLADREALMEAIYDLRPIHKPGMHPAYHALTGGFIFDELARRVVGEDLREYMRRTVCEPLGFKNLNYGVGQDETHLVARNVFTGPEPAFLAKDLLIRALGRPMSVLVDLSNDPLFLTSIVPAANIIGTANEVSRFFEILLGKGTLDGVRVFKARTVDQAITPVVKGKFDRILFMPVPYSAGFMLSGDVFGFYGPMTPKAFGHLGFTTCLAWADPERDLSAALMTTGKPFITPELVIWLNIMRTIAARIPRKKELIA